MIKKLYSLIVYFFSYIDVDGRYILKKEKSKEIKFCIWEKNTLLKGRRVSSTCELENIHKEKIDFSHMPSGLKTPKMSNLIRLSVRDTTLCVLGKIA